MDIRKRKHNKRPSLGNIAANGGAAGPGLWFSHSITTRRLHFWELRKKCIMIEECTQLTASDWASLSRAAVSTYWKRTGQLSHVSLPDVRSSFSWTSKSDIRVIAGCVFWRVDADVALDCLVVLHVDGQGWNNRSISIHHRGFPLTNWTEARPTQFESETSCLRKSCYYGDSLCLRLHTCGVHRAFSVL